MTALTVLYLVIYAFLMATGQILFKLAANQAASAGFNVPQLAANPFFLLAILVYGAMTVFWVWLLMRVPLNAAYPFVALSFVFTPLMARFVVGEMVSVWLWAGTALIIAGLLLIVLKAA